MKNKILICGLMSYEDPAYWDLSHQCISTTKGNQTEITYVVGLDRVDKSSVRRLKEYLPNLKMVDVSIIPPRGIKETTTEKRVRIGQLYNNLFSYVSAENEYVCIMDGDVAFVKTGWDKMLINELVGDCVIIGSEYGPRWPEKFQGFPNLSFSLMKWPIIKQLNIDCRGSGKTLKVSKEDSKFFGLKAGNKLNREIGWKFPKAVREAGYDGKCMQVVPGNSKKAQLIFPQNKREQNIYKINRDSNLKSLFEIHWKDEIVVTHLTKSTCLAFDQHPISKYWVNKVRQRLRKIQNVSV